MKVQSGAIAFLRPLDPSEYYGAAVLGSFVGRGGQCVIIVSIGILIVFCTPTPNHQQGDENGGK